MQYEVNYKELKADYELYCAYSDDCFLEELPAIIHFACIVSYFKQLSLNETLSDLGIVHRLVHLLYIEELKHELPDIRKDFETLLKLS